MNQQHATWNGSAGRSWVDAQETLDEMFQPFEDLLVDAALARPRAHVLDVGCGTGSTIVAVQERLGSGARCVGVDISQPMLDQARRRAASSALRPTFIRADAELYSFERESFDLVLSRFGVMFFSDAARAMANLRRASRAGAELHFLVWRSPAENPFMTTAERAAAAVLPHIPPRVPDAPGQFGFADANRVSRLLKDGGWADVVISPVDVECSFAAQALPLYATRLGPVGSALHDSDEPTKARVLAAVLPAFAAYVHGATVRFNAACWSISAHAA
jgi:SAM-dependent methyltransferase